MGDVVNLAARLMTAATFGGDDAILCDEATFEAAKGDIAFKYDPRAPRTMMVNFFTCCNALHGNSFVNQQSGCHRFATGCKR